MKKIISTLLYFFYSKVIYSEISLRSNLSSCNYYYSGYNGAFGFGDHVVFFLNIKKKLNNKNKILCYSKLQIEIAKFFIEEKFIVKTFIILPKFLNDSHLGYNFLLNKKNFKPKKIQSPHNKQIPASLLYHGTKSQLKFIYKKLSQSQVTFGLKKILKKKTVVIFIKNFSLIYKKKDINFQVRQTKDLNKIFKILNYLINKNFNVIILGKKNDNFIKIFENQKKITKNIFVFNNLSNNYSIADQIYLAFKAYAFIGNLSGAMVFFDILKKKTILIDCVLQDSINDWGKNRLVLFKKCLNIKKNKKEIFSPYKKYNNNECIVIENSYHQILRKIRDHLKIT